MTQTLNLKPSTLTPTVAEQARLDAAKNAEQQLADDDDVVVSDIDEDDDDGLV
jgi:hypothetical protein